ncbi:hypothetical protein N790_00575 [Arenimonas malthae CC-JY-1]|uniref:EAL domain-containing protein n=1 Tax=Arenimonas malthae CC-JY-1 TaxID=1384054 RepID=A0A091BL72_9GAMM|nr:hypothetical protein N790_00575 [Arenimonas malthae CC-JY-1]
MRTDLVKLDMALIRNVHEDAGRHAIIRGVALMCADLGMKLIAEGVESREELESLQAMGIDLFQGYLLARPAFQALPSVDWPG